jgi:hypothetical protein
MLKKLIILLTALLIKESLQVRFNCSIAEPHCYGLKPKADGCFIKKGNTVGLCYHVKGGKPDPEFVRKNEKLEEVQLEKASKHKPEMCEFIPNLRFLQDYCSTGWDGSCICDDYSCYCCDYAQVLG